jgi:hypothetical protein
MPRNQMYLAPKDASGYIPPNVLCHLRFQEGLLA